MIPPSDCVYSQNIPSNPPHATDYLDQYLEDTQSSSSSLDLAGSQSEGSSFAAVSTPTWFTDFILYESDDADFQADPTSVSQTSGSARMDLSCDISTIPLFASSPRSVPQLTETNVPNNTGFLRWPDSTEIDDAYYAVDFNSNMPNLHWKSTEPALNLSARNHPESATGDDSEKSSPEQSISAQDGVTGRLSVPRIRNFKCHTCQSHFLSESRLSKHRWTSHAPARFICCTCGKKFKQEKDLRRHQLTHEPSKRLFACSCTKTYPRYDGLLRHFARMALSPRETGCHNAAESNPR